MPNIKALVMICSLAVVIGCNSGGSSSTPQPSPSKPSPPGTPSPKPTSTNEFRNTGCSDQGVCVNDTVYIKGMGYNYTYDPDYRDKPKDPLESLIIPVRPLVVNGIYEDGSLNACQVIKEKDKPLKCAPFGKLFGAELYFASSSTKCTAGKVCKNNFLDLKVARGRAVDLIVVDVLKDGHRYVVEGPAELVEGNYETYIVDENLSHSAKAFCSNGICVGDKVYIETVKYTETAGRYRKLDVVAIQTGLASDEVLVKEDIGPKAERFLKWYDWKNVFLPTGCTKSNSVCVGQKGLVRYFDGAGDVVGISPTKEACLVQYYSSSQYSGPQYSNFMKTEEEVLKELRSSR